MNVADENMFESVLSFCGLEVFEMTYEELTELTRDGGKESIRLSLSGYVVCERKLVLMSFSSRMLSVMLVIIGSILSRPDIGRPGNKMKKYVKNKVVIRDFVSFPYVFMKSIGDILHIWLDAITLKISFFYVCLMWVESSINTGVQKQVR